MDGRRVSSTTMMCTSCDHFCFSLCNTMTLTLLLLSHCIATLISYRHPIHQTISPNLLINKSYTNQHSQFLKIQSAETTTLLKSILDLMLVNLQALIHLVSHLHKLYTRIKHLRNCINMKLPMVKVKWLMQSMVTR